MGRNLVNKSLSYRLHISYLFPNSHTFSVMPTDSAEDSTSGDERDQQRARESPGQWIEYSHGGRIKATMYVDDKRKTKWSYAREGQTANGNQRQQTGSTFGILEDPASGASVPTECDFEIRGAMENLEDMMGHMEDMLGEMIGMSNMSFNDSGNMPGLDSQSHGRSAYGNAPSIVFLENPNSIQSGQRCEPNATQFNGDVFTTTQTFSFSSFDGNSGLQQPHSHRAARNQRSHQRREQRGDYQPILEGMACQGRTFQFNVYSAWHVFGRRMYGECMRD